MLVVDDAGTVHEVNDAAAWLVGRSRHDLLGRDRRDVVEPAAAHAQVTAQLAALRAGRHWVGSYAVGLERATVVEVAAEPRLVADRHLVQYARRDGAPRTTHGANGDGTAIRLTARERQVVTMLAAGATSPQLAADLHLSEHTVRTHVRNAMARTGAMTRAHLAAIAWRAGLIDAEAEPTEPPGFDPDPERPAPGTESPAEG